MLSKSMLHWSPAGGLDVSETRRLKVLTDENAKLKKLLSKANPDQKLNVLPAHYNLLDAQASFQDDSFEALWRARFLEAIKK
ncbi:MAG: hypothetical protein ABIO35_06120 [Nitrobacter sp.]